MALDVLPEGRLCGKAFVAPFKRAAQELLFPVVAPVALHSVALDKTQGATFDRAGVDRLFRMATPVDLQTGLAGKAFVAVGLRAAPGSFSAMAQHVVAQSAALHEV